MWVCLLAGNGARDPPLPTPPPLGPRSPLPAARAQRAEILSKKIAPPTCTCLNQTGANPSTTFLRRILGCVSDGVLSVWVQISLPTHSSHPLLTQGVTQCSGQRFFKTVFYTVQENMQNICCRRTEGISWRVGGHFVILPPLASITSCTRERNALLKPSTSRVALMSTQICFTRAS